MPSPQGWLLPLQTVFHPFPGEASRSVRCGHPNRKQSANRAAGITQRLSPTSWPIKTTRLYSRETQKPWNHLSVLAQRKQDGDRDTNTAGCDFIKSVEFSKNNKVYCPTLVKSVGHHTTDVTSSLWP